MLSTAAALAMLWTTAFSGSGEPMPYDVAVARDAVVLETAATASGSIESAETDLSSEQLELMAGDPDWRASARLYHAGGGGATSSSPHHRVHGGRSPSSPTRASPGST